ERSVPPTTVVLPSRPSTALWRTAPSLLPGVAPRSRSHSLHYFLTGMTDPGPGMPQFVIVGCVDGELLWNYNSLGRTVRPIMGWLPQEDQEHWDAETQKARDIELDFYEFLGRLQVHYNKSEGSHTLQKMIGCDILEDGNIRGYVQYGFDGRDYIAFDMDTMTFTAADAVAEITKRRWEQEGTYAEGCKHELGTVCVQNLRKYLEHGKAALKRRAQSQGSLLSLPCRPRRRIQRLGHNFSMKAGLRRGPCGWSGPSSLHSPVGPIAGTILGQPSLENTQGGELGRGRGPI
uniref:MHC class I-like antigen recognition-like domain-containing protein n=1 Tax=Gallus gallus TaxID=9031 RepID=A0A8V0X6V0_CHICK